MLQSSNDNAGPFIGLAVIVSLFFVNVWYKQRRASRLEKWAEDNGLQYFGADLPREFPVHVLDETIGSWGNALDTIGGRRGDDYLLTFQIERGYGRQAWLPTVVARRSPQARRHHATISPEEYLRAAEWRIWLSQRPFLLRSVKTSPDTILRIWALLA